MAVSAHVQQKLEIFGNWTTISGILANFLLISYLKKRIQSPMLYLRGSVLSSKRMLRELVERIRFGQSL